MGILNLSKLIGDYAPLAVKENEMKNYFGRKIAIDASMSIYQFLIAVRQDGNTLTNDDGETTSHLMGIFYRTIRMMKHGIKPVYVFDGKPPQMKSGELAKRQERRDDAQKSLQKAEEDGDLESVNKFSRRLVKVTKQHNEECRQLLTLMGVPHIEAPCEAEAQCAELVKGGKVYAVATEDMDGLTFGAQILLRHMTFSESRKMPIKEFHLERLLSELELTKTQFIDLCILLGCDYCESIRGVGPKRALELIREFSNMEAIIKRLNETKKFVVPDQWPYEEARRLFTDPDVTPANEVVIKWSEPDIEGLVKFMCVDNGFNEERIRNGADKLFSAKKSQTQGRLDTFFKVIPNPATVSKRKPEETAAAAKKKSKPSSARGRKPK